MILGIPLASGKALEARDWIEMKSKNFLVQSVLSEKKTFELVKSLKVFRIAVSILTNISETESAIPTNIIVLKSAAEIYCISLDGRNLNWFMFPGLRENTMVIREAWGVDETTVILHGYVHYLVRIHGGQIYPKWFAEYLSTGGMKRGYFDIGRVLESRKDNFAYSHWISMEDGISGAEYDDCIFAYLGSG